MASVMRSTTGQATPSPACSEATRTGVALYVRPLYCHTTGSIAELSSHSGLAVNFILIESLQRFYQFYGDEVQVSGQKPSFT